MLAVTKTAKTPQDQLRNYIDFCLRGVASEGIEKMGYQGGYTTIPEEAPALTFQDKNMAYWFYDETKPTIPSARGMKEELERYIQDNLDTCLADYYYFKEQGYDIEESEKIIDVELLDDKTHIRLNYTVSLEKEDFFTEAEDFSFESDVRLKLIAGIAAQLTIMESQVSYLEHHTKKMISFFSGTEKNLLPPFTSLNTDFDCKVVSWEKDDVQTMLNKVLEKNIPELKVRGTDIPEIKEKDPVKQGVKQGMVQNLLGDVDLPEVKIDFVYADDLKNFDVKPNSGNLITPHVVSETRIPFLENLCIMRYRFKYDMIYPVVIQIKDKKSTIDQEQYVFQFPIRVIIKGNQPREFIPSQDFGFDEQDLKEKNITITGSNELLCRDSQKTDSIEVNVVSSETKTPLEDVMISYECGTKTCSIGSTDEDGMLKKGFPRCINGRIILSKTGFEPEIQKLTIYKDIPETLNFTLGERKELDIELKLIHLPTYLKQFYETGNPDIKDILIDPSITQEAIISTRNSKHQSVLYPFRKKISLAEGTYDLTIFVSDSIDIAEQELAGQKIQEISSNYWPIGTTEIEDWYIPSLKGKTKVILYGFIKHHGSELVSWEDLEDIDIDEDGTISYIYQGDNLTIKKEVYKNYIMPELR